MTYKWLCTGVFFLSLSILPTFSVKSDEINPEITIYTSGNGIEDLLPHDTAGICAVTTGGLVIWETETGSYTKMTTKDGLSDNWLTCGTLDQDGILWMGSMLGGLNTWDGARITPYPGNSGLPYPEITALDVDTENRIWAGFGGPFGSGLGIKNGETWTIFRTTDGLLHNYVNAIETRGIDAWAGSRGGLNYLRSEGIIRSYTTADGLPSDRVQCLCSGDSNTLWIGTDQGIAFFDGADFTSYGEGDGLPSADIRSLHRDASTGDLWIGTAAGLALFRNNTFSAIDTSSALESDTFPALTSVTGTLLAGSATAGFLEIRNDQPGRAFLTEDWLPDNDVRAVAFDENRLWFATYRHGVGYVDGDTVKTWLLEADGRILELRFLTRDHTGRMYTGDLYRGVFIHEEGTWSRLTIDDGLPAEGVMNVFIDDDNSPWFASWGGGVAHLSHSGWTYIGSDDGLPSPHVYCIDKDRQGHYWFCHDQGVTRYDGNTLENWFEEDGLIFHRVYAATHDDQNVMWFGACKGLSRFEDGRFTNYMESDGLTHYRVRHFTFDAQNVLWMATGGGVCALDNGTFYNFTPSDGVAGYETFWCCSGPGGSLWFSAEGGITRIDPACTLTETGVEIVIPSDRVESGDFFDCTVRVVNSGTENLEGYPLFVVLETAGTFFFGPDFLAEPDHYLDEYPGFPPGITEVTVIPPLHWPAETAGTGSAIFYAGLATPGLTALHGTMDSADFRWE